MGCCISKIKINEFDKVVVFEPGEEDVDSIQLDWNEDNEYPSVIICFVDGTDRNYFGSNIVWYEE